MTNRVVVVESAPATHPLMDHGDPIEAFAFISGDVVKKGDMEEVNDLHFYEIDNVVVTLVKVKGLWYISSLMVNDKDKIGRIGPFSDAEEAFVNVKLMGKRREALR